MYNTATNEIGHKYGELTVISRYGTNHKRKATWSCKCECGKTKIVPGDMLRRGKTKSCGCIRGGAKTANTLPLGVASFNNFLQGYKAQAKRRKIEWKLSEQDFKKIVDQDCFYCGAAPVPKIHRHRKPNGHYPVNGIDRLDNSIGYTSENSIPCCKICNMAKRDMSQKDFIHWIWQAYNQMRPGEPVVA